MGAKSQAKNSIKCGFWFWFLFWVGFVRGEVAEIAILGRNIFDNGNLFLILFLGLRLGFLEKGHERYCKIERG